YLYKIYKKKNEDLLIIFSLTSLVAAYFIQNLLVFDTILSYLSLFFILGYIYTLEKGYAEEEKIKSINLNNLKIFSLLFIFIGFGYLIFWQNIRPATSAFYTRQAMNEANKETYYYSNFSNFVRKSLSYQTVWDAEYIEYYTTIFKEFRSDQNISKEAIGADLEYITEAGEKYLKYNNQDVKYISQLAILYEMLYDMLRDEKDLARAEMLMKEAISLSEERVYFYHVLAQIYEFTGRDEEALAELEKAKELNENVPETYWSLALIYSKLEDNDNIISNVKKALARNFSFSRVEDIITVLPIFEAEKDFVSLINLYSQAARLEPGSTDHLAHLAAAYAAIGQNEEAIRTAEKIISLNPSAIDQISQFIIDVNEGKYLK
ncbi:MAG: tetratricopeptide repeat protein, partial [Patescibacteria group bacterium]